MARLAFYARVFLHVINNHLRLHLISFDFIAGKFVSNSSYISVMPLPLHV